MMHADVSSPSNIPLAIAQASALTGLVLICRVNSRVPPSILTFITIMGAASLRLLTCSFAPVRVEICALTLARVSLIAAGYVMA